MAPYRLIITGGRDADDEREVIRILKQFLSNQGVYSSFRPLVIVHGGCKSGVDAIVENWVRECQPVLTTTEVWPAEDFGSWPSCGPKRNSHMVSLGADACLAMPTKNSKGTWDCARKAGEAKIPVWLYTVKGDDQR